MTLAAGTRLGPYEILSPIGSGGMGEVYRARDARLDRDVAIKVVVAQLAGDKETLARFEREAKAVAALTHPNILAIHDIGFDHGVAFAVTELLDGETLRSRIKRGPIPWAKAIEIACAVSDGLAAAHAKGIIHRDLKPENIFLTSDGRLKILDFGIAIVRPTEGLSTDVSGQATVSVTETATVIGTVGYMSPEQVTGKPVAAACDIFAVGCVLYEMLTGRRAFARPTPIETLSAILRDHPPALPPASAQCPIELQRIVYRCLEKAPGARFQSAPDLAFALRGVGTVTGGSPSVRLRGRAKGRIRAVAVLPFANESADSGLEYLSDGITESVINSLAQVSALRVIARATAFRYRSREIDPQEVGRDLSVDSIVTGRLALIGDTLIISVELVDATRGWHVWGHQYKRELSDILTVQQEIAREISEALRLRLSGADKKRLAKRYTQHVGAYRLYLEGRFHWHKRTQEGLHKGIECFERAIEADPAYALAYAGLADSYNLLGYYGHIPPKEAWQKAKAAALTGLEIDPLLPDVHTSLGALSSAYAWDWAEAGRQHARAIALKASDSTAFFWYGMYRIRMGQFDEAFTLMDRALEIDPLSLSINAYTGWLMFCARQYDRALGQLQKTLQLDLTFVPTHVHLGCVYQQQGAIGDAMKAFKTAVRLSPGDLQALKGLGHLYGSTGNVDGAREILGRLDVLSQQAVAQDAIGIIYAGMNEKDEALEWLNRAADERSPWLIWLHVDPRFDALRDDPRFIELLGRIGLSSAQLDTARSGLKFPHGRL